MWLIYTIAVGYAQCDSLNQINQLEDYNIDASVVNCASQIYWEAVSTQVPDYFDQFDYFDWDNNCPTGEAYYNGTCTEFVCVRMSSDTGYIGMGHCVPRSSCGATITLTPFDDTEATGTLEECTTCDGYTLEPYYGRIEPRTIDGETRTICPDVTLATMPNCLLALPEDAEYCEADYDDCCADPSVDNCWDDDEQCYKDVHKVTWIEVADGSFPPIFTCPEPTTSTPSSDDSRIEDEVIVLITAASVSVLAIAIYLSRKYGPPPQVENLL